MWVAQKSQTFWQHVHRGRYWIGDKWHRHRNIVLFTTAILCVPASLYLSPLLQRLLGGIYTNREAIEGLRGLVLGVGTALIGAAAIVTSLVLFAMQVNIERMPHGLFRRLSEDLKLLSSFALAFLMALVVAALSQAVEEKRFAYVVIAVCWLIIFTLISFMYAYRRALVLVNPLQQLGMLIRETRRELRVWTRHAQRATPLLKPKGNTNSKPSHLDSTHDLARVTYFQINNRWAEGAKRSVRHAISFARRYAEQGDYEVSSAALQAIVSINAAYIEAKGKTFFGNTLLIDNPLVSDAFINETLECLRQNAQSGIARRDEPQIEQTLQTMAALVHLYLGIDYSSMHASKSHAQLAASYLTSTVQAAVPHDMADVLLEGQRVMGQSARYVLAYGSPNDIAILSEKIALIACAGCAKEDYRSVMMEGMTQLANLTVDLLLRPRDQDIHFAVKKIREDVSLITGLFLNVATTPLSNSHSTFLGPYYSSTSVQSLRTRLTTVVNELCELPSDNADAQSVIRNFETWSDGLYLSEKELLLAAIKARSHFVFDMIHWITGVTEILLALSNAPACNDHNQEALQNHALWLISTLTWIPDDKDTVAFLENFDMTEELFEAAVSARSRGCDDVARKIGIILASWAFKSGRHQIGRGTFERGLCGLATFALMGGDEEITWTRAVITTQLMSNSAPEQDIRDQAAREIWNRIARLHENGHFFSRIEMSIKEADHNKLRPLLVEIAGLLSPGIPDQTDVV